MEDGTDFLPPVSGTESICELARDMGRFPHEIKALPRRERLELLYSRLMSIWRERHAARAMQAKHADDKNLDFETRRAGARATLERDAERDQWKK